jgi:type VI secretion system protein ImpF
MARPEIERTVQQSVLDRLIDTDRHLAGDPMLTWGESVRQLKLALARDLEWLLNTRRVMAPLPEDYEEVRHSLYRYGLPDIGRVTRDVVEAQRRLVREVEETLALFEPRLAGARVNVVSDEKDGKWRCHFVVEALLRMDPTPERIVFDTTLDLTMGEYDVDTGAGA